VYGLLPGHPDWGEIKVPPMMCTKYETLANDNAPIREYDCTLALPNNPTMVTKV
jgi:hypothetical protein